MAGARPRSPTQNGGLLPPTPPEETTEMKFGLLLPHFGEHAGRENLLEGSKLAEDVGFDSVWVRDHLVFEPHGEMEKPNRTFYDALTTLTAIGAVTERIELGTGSLIPFRHPLVTALMAGTITQLVGPRLILGFGAGTFDHEFDAIGWGDRDRVELVRSNAEILRRVFTENDVDYSDDNFTFNDITIEPKPVGGRVPFWYCGATPRSARLVFDFRFKFDRFFEQIKLLGSEVLPHLRG